MNRNRHHMMASRGELAVSINALSSVSFKIERAILG